MNVCNMCRDDGASATCTVHTLATSLPLPPAEMDQASDQVCLLLCMCSKGSAHRALGEWEAAVAALEKALALDPSDTGVKAELIKADKELKKFRYGW